MHHPPPFRPHRLLAALVFAAFAASASAGTAPDEIITDRTVRYINHAVITLGDIHRRLQLIAFERRQRDLPPLTTAELPERLRQILEDLTDETLILQEADNLGVMVDEEAIKRQIHEWSRRTENRTIRGQLLERRMRIDGEKIRFVLRLYSDRWPSVRPNDIQAAYLAHPERWARPARTQVARVLLGSATPADQQRLEDRLTNCFRSIQADPALAGVVDDATLDRILAAAPADRTALIKERLRAALAAAPAAPTDATATLLAVIRLVLTDHDAIQDPAAVAATLTALRTAAAAVADPAGRQAAFLRLAREHTGAEPALEWIEPGTYSEEFDRRITATAIGDLSEVFADGPCHCLVLVTARDGGGTRPLDEVAAVIERELEQQRLEEVRRNLLARLRLQAHITDIPLESAGPAREK
jgi:parvulin-like peptidyl-prolyl isomerase